MDDVKIKVTIDGDTYSDKQLRLIRYEREKHVLQEMIYLGAEIPYNGNSLTYDDVNYLSYEEAEELNLKARSEIAADEFKKLYASELQRSARMWREIVRDYHDENPMIRATADLNIVGMTLEQFQEKMASVLSGGDSSVMTENPEHFCFTKTEDCKGQERMGVETMGMYGGPTEVIVMPGQDSLKDKVVTDNGFPDATAGTSKLLDGTLRHDIAYHQMKPSEKGFDVRTTVYFPKNTPKEMIEGHKLHLAMETYEMIKEAAKI